jgi:hypothetical protein
LPLFIGQGLITQAEEKKPAWPLANSVAAVLRRRHSSSFKFHKFSAQKEIHSKIAAKMLWMLEVVCNFFLLMR